MPVRIDDGEGRARRGIHCALRVRTGMSDLATQIEEHNHDRQGCNERRVGRSRGVPQAEAPLDIWVIRQRDGRWSNAELVGPPVSTDSNESYPSVVADGSLYFTSNRPGGVGAADIYRAQRLADGSFGAAVNIGSPPNSNLGEGDTFVSPDEQFLILSGMRPGGFGKSDLHVSFRTGSTWGPPINLGPSINTPDIDFCPMVTPDGKYLFFSRRYGEGGWETAKDADVFWVDVEVVKRLRK